MALAGELLSLMVSLAQEIGIVAGAGAVTMTLVGHLLSLHAHKNETVFAYVRAARHIRALALITIIVSGGAAMLVHVQSGTLGVFLAPAFLFTWLLIALLTVFYFAELKVEGYARDAVEGFEGANWYALLIVHTMAPVVGWMLLLSIYFGWLAVFAIIWIGFVWIMRHNSTLPPKSRFAPNPFPAPAQTSNTLTPSPMAKKTEAHPNHSLLPMIAELDLPASKTEMPTLNGAGLAALHVMPKRPEDIEDSKRGPVVRMSDE